ncbi:cystathionine gamma-synthase family protein [Orrella daihaiensis]|uniref:Cystathionine gamma-synthase family protein n=1 Tax=Orrella daihaiensis TaxID=2782176 RepID=A0ABY4AG13_9BURK|nr:cystathionine gamma-synthase family protein [Orrella daihaiensis]UOD49230.1 cystathionine gamma-synthase family protein [Orrella daihaiensis]
MTAKSTLKGFTTKILHHDRLRGTEHNAVHQPIHTSSQYAYADAKDLVAVFQGRPGFSYARQGTPTTAALEAKLAQMEAGTSAITFATGMAALTAVFATLLKSGDHLLASQYVFGNTNSLFGTLSQLGIEVTLVDATNLDAVKAAVRTNTRMIFVETIGNPGTQIADLEGIGEVAKANNLVYFVDGTLTSPYLFQAKSVGASLTMHSLSKHIAGHAQALGGVVIDTGLFDWSSYPNILPTYQKNDPKGWAMAQIKKKGLRDMGATLAAEPAHRIAIGAETLALRLDKACANALALAQLLDGHRAVARVAYPGLPDHQQHDRAARLFGDRFGTLLSFSLNPGLDCVEFLNSLSLPVLATHVGDTRTLALPVAQTIYHEMGSAMRAQMGIEDGLIRVSVGIEDLNDVLADFSKALDAMV